MGRDGQRLLDGVVGGDEEVGGVGTADAFVVFISVTCVFVAADTVVVVVGNAFVGTTYSGGSVISCMRVSNVGSFFNAVVLNSSTVNCCSSFVGTSA